MASPPSAGSRTAPVVAAALLALAGAALTGPSSSTATASASPAAVPSREGIDRARRFARGRAGRVSFAVVDSRGALACFRCRRAYHSASLSKAMLLVADLRRAHAARLALSTAERATLARMIRRSGNRAADQVFARTGDAGLLAVARLAGMREFGSCGYWACSRLTAADQARLFARLPALLPRAERAFGLRLLETVVPRQSWGIPPASRPAGWRTWFKGGWRREAGARLVHQAARLERDGQAIALAVLTDGNPGHWYGARTIRGIAARLVPAGRAGPRSIGLPQVRRSGSPNAPKASARRSSTIGWSTHRW